VYAPYVAQHRSIPSREVITETLLTVPLEGAKMYNEVDESMITGIGGAQTNCDHVLEGI